VIVERSMHEQFLSNTYLVADVPGGTAVMLDAGGPVAPLLDRVEADGLTLSHVLLTHRHHDHVAELGAVRELHPDAVVVAHPLEEVEGCTGTVEPGERIVAGELEIEAVHTPGHTPGMLSFLVNGTDVFTGDTLFKGSVGGVRGGGPTGYADLRESIMDRLMKLDPAVRIHPGHTEPTTVGEEWEGNPFIRVWRGLDPEGDAPCTALGKPARLVLLAEDYDGGHKAWVRWSDGSDDIVPGSQLQRGAEPGE
jgi:glyoxylase-like metal-dependent hydrolase (beta-lactamase superfamily II)